MVFDLALALLFGGLSWILLDIGLGVQKYALTPSRFNKIAIGKKRKSTRSAVWVVGLGMTGGSVVLSYMAIDVSGPSMFASLVGIGLVALAVFSLFALGEKVKRIMLAGMLLIGLGTVLFGYFIKVQAITFDVTGLIAFVAATSCFCIVIASISFKRGYWHAGTIFGVVAGSLAGIGITFQKGTTEASGLSYQLLASPFFYAWAGATGISFLVTQFALTKGTAISVVPSYNSTQVVLPQIGAIVVFSENIELIQWLGLALIVVGIMLLTGFKAEPPKQIKPKRK
jgi:uncharacterized membrane protein